MRTGYCAVTADILHSGHIKFFLKCRKLCDELIVGIMTDECVEKYKGKRPVLPYDERAYVVERLKMVDRVVPQDTYEYPASVIEAYVVFDSVKHQRKGADYCIAYDETISSTKIKEKIKKEV